MSARLGLLLIPALVAAQEPDGARSQVDSLLAVPSVASVIDDLDARFIGHFLMLVPDLSTEDQEVLADAVGSAFGASAVRDDVANAMADRASAELLSTLLEMRRTGAQAEMMRIAEEYEPTRSLSDFVAGVGAPERGRLQLMATLAQAQGASDFELILDEAVRRVAHRLVNSFGGGLGPFEPMSDDVFDAAYRERTLSVALESLYRLETVSDDLVQSVIDEYQSEAARWYVDAYASAILAAVQAAGRRAVELTVVAEEEPSPDVAESRVPCSTQTCGFIVEWAGGEPAGNNYRFGAARDLEALVMQGLIGTGYLLTRGRRDQGFTIRLRPTTQAARCEVVSGTDNRRCTAIDRVRVEFLGEYPGLETPNAFSVRNLCGADEVMAIERIAALVARRLHYGLTTYEGDDRRVPRC